MHLLLKRYADIIFLSFIKYSLQCQKTQKTKNGTKLLIENALGIHLP